MNKRIDWLDVARGIGVICIIFGHISFYLGRTLLQMFVYGFSVFVFFIVSGINFSKKINQPITKVLKGLLKNLVIPYAICVIIIIIFKYVYYCGEYDFNQVIFNYVIQIRYRSLWYVPVLFFSQIITWILFQVINNDRLRLLIVIALYIASSFLNYYFGFKWLWNLDCVAYGVFYLYIGVILKGFIINFDKKWFINSLIALILLIISCISTYYNYVTNSNYEYISFTNIHIVPLSIVSAIAGSLSIILVAKTIHKCKFFQYLGKNSFSFIAFNIETIALLLDETAINQLFWSGNKTLRTLLYIALMVIGLALLNIIYKFLYKLTLNGCRKIASYNNKA